MHGPSLLWIVGFDDQSYIMLLHDEHWRMKVEFRGIRTVYASCLWFFAAVCLHDLSFGIKKSKERFGLLLW